MGTKARVELVLQFSRINKTKAQRKKIVLKLRAGLRRDIVKLDPQLPEIRIV